MNLAQQLSRALAQSGSFRRLEPQDLPTLMDWRNSQQSVLRQQVPLTMEQQSEWWNNTVAPSYSQERPSIVLLARDRGQGMTSYGGLTNVDWASLRAEVSFLADSTLAGDEVRYSQELLASLDFYAELAFKALELRRLHAETWSFRRLHLKTLEEFGFRLEGRLRKHVIKNGTPTDALLHGLLVDDRTTV